VNRNGPQRMQMKTQRVDDSWQAPTSLLSQPPRIAGSPAANELTSYTQCGHLRIRFIELLGIHRARSSRMISSRRFAQPPGKHVLFTRACVEAVTFTKTSEDFTEFIFGFPDW